MLAYYYSSRVKKYLRIGRHGAEMDETKVGAMQFKMQTKCDEFRWIFGIIC